MLFGGLYCLEPKIDVLRGDVDCRVVDVGFEEVLNKSMAMRRMVFGARRGAYFQETVYPTMPATVKSDKFSGISVKFCTDKAWVSRWWIGIHQVRFCSFGLDFVNIEMIYLTRVCSLTS